MQWALRGIESISEAKEFFEGLVRDYPELLDEGDGDNEVSLILERLKSEGASGTEEELKPLGEYLTLKSTIKSLSQWYLNEETNSVN